MNSAGNYGYYSLPWLCNPRPLGFDWFVTVQESISKLGRIGKLYPTVAVLSNLTAAPVMTI